MVAKASGHKVVFVCCANQVHSAKVAAAHTRERRESERGWSKVNYKQGNSGDATTSIILVTYILPFFLPAMTSEFHRGLNLLRRLYMTRVK